MFNIQLHIVLELADAGDLSRMIKVIPQPQPRILLSFRFLFPSLDAFLFGCTFVDILFWQIILPQTWTWRPNLIAFQKTKTPYPRKNNMEVLCSAVCCVGTHARPASHAQRFGSHFHAAVLSLFSLSLFSRLILLHSFLSFSLLFSIVWSPIIWQNLLLTVSLFYYSFS